MGSRPVSSGSQDSVLGAMASSSVSNIFMRMRPSVRSHPFRPSLTMRSERGSYGISSTGASVTGGSQTMK